ncbi:hypothetical protein CERSUDRAFT_113510 [Gelatoporia subvermispora B]|uniref:Knr4/Smi1-like domain-containing protein n=1 Tax=Ceriporiopsis subvermispora (strain B) TaxID=914234 RepID=M2R1F4_CERS8|nr:hypothetical protein CERSUDRAFT_113510 [Gelatoporia subvermispora B]
MSWLAGLFSSRTSSRKAMSSTHEAFSLPTSSPGFAHPDAFNPDSLNTPNSAASTSYSYPPPSAGGAYDYVPSSAGARSRPMSILPLHNASLPPLPSYPPLDQTWDRIQQWLSREYPELGDTLNYGILPQDLAQIEMAFGFALPSPVRESYLCVDGQEAESAAGCSEGLLFGLTLLPLEDVLEEWRFWREVDDDPNTGANPHLREMMQSIPPGWVRREYSLRGWIPLVKDKVGNYLGVDMNPGEGGSVGQVIVFGRDFDTKVVMWRGDGPGGWAKWLAGFAEDLESGEGFELGGSNDSEGSEDSVGYESYFFDGVGGGQGDGGGDAGTGGLRLTGEYKGWSVLEAWADRSMRRWQDAGLLPEAPLSADKGKTPEKVPINRLQLVSTGAEVPIPVLADVEETSALAAPLGNVTNQHSLPQARQPLPIISVTKPPAPKPVDLPSPESIEPPSSALSYPDGDLEAGMAMAQIDGPSAGVLSGVHDNNASPISRSEPSPSESRMHDPTPLSVAPQRSLTESPDAISSPARAASTPDLLVDPELSLDSAFVLSDDGDDDGDGNGDSGMKSEDESPVLVDAIEAQVSSPVTTIRSEPSRASEEQNDLVVIEGSDPVLSVPAHESTPIPQAKHEKKKSTSSVKSVKKVGQNGKRKKDSVSQKGSG